MSSADAMYSFVLRVNALRSSAVSLYRHPIPVRGQKPPKPISEESENVVIVGLRKMTLLIEMPSFAELRNSSHRDRSSKVRFVSLTLFLLLAMPSILRRLFMKCRASGIMKQTWFNLPMRVESSSYETVLFDVSSCIDCDQATHFLIVSVMVKLLVSICQPKK